MPDPKLLRIVKDIAARVATIKVASGFYTEIGKRVERGNFTFNQEDTPASSVFLQGGDIGGEASGANKTDAVITIRSSHVYSENPEDFAIQMLADIHKAVEIKQDYTPGPSDIIRKVQEQGWQINYPEDASSMVSVEVNYSFSYSRKYGED